MMNNIRVLRAEEEWQRAGAYMVRIQGMNREYGISLREEIDEHDGEGTRYIVLLDGEYPVATCRFYEIAPGTVMLGRVVVLPEYRRQQLGLAVVQQAEQWMQELGYAEVKIESRVEAVGFYLKQGYTAEDDTVFQNSVFQCINMKKKLN